MAGGAGGRPNRRDHFPCLPTLAQLRSGAERFGIVHAYHATAADRDNDFYFRIGVIDDAPSVDDGLAEGVAGRLRGRLAACRPVLAMIGLPQLSVAFYASPELPPATTQAFALNDPGITGAFIGNRLSQGKGGGTATAAAGVRLCGSIAERRYQPWRIHPRGGGGSG